LKVGQSRNVILSKIAGAYNEVFSGFGLKYLKLHPDSHA